jgi:3-hydroxybutyryl-CoA dehydrogenase
MNASEIEVGVVGLGLMGTSISACLLMAGHPVNAVAPISSDLENAAERIRKHLERSYQEGICKEKAEVYLENLIITEDYSCLAKCRLVIECTLENEAIKRSVYEKVERYLPEDAILASNTSAIPISDLQKLTKVPQRFLGLHWAEPSHTTRFLEIICGAESDVSQGEYLYELAHCWNKEPTLVRKDIRGFITNRLMYAMYREAFFLVENGYATIEDVDRACRNNPGYWMTLVGVFRWMDLTGVDAYGNVMKDLFPTLNNRTEVPELMKRLMEKGSKGVANGKGFYDYTPEEARMWEETFTAFSYEIRELALKYPADIVKKKIESAKK